MAFQTNFRPQTNSRPQTNPQPRADDIPYLDRPQYKVLRVRELRSGTVMADLMINGVVIKSVSVMARRDDGHRFLSWPSEQGRDGRYYKTAYCRLYDKDQEDIIQAIYDCLGANT